MKHIVKTLLFLAGGVVGGYLLLVLVFCLPKGRIHNNVLESATAFDGEYKVLIHDNIATKTDDFTDALMLLTAENNNDKNPFTSSIYAYHLTNEGSFPNKTITDMENQDNTSEQYSRYWHGYLIFLKPLLLFFDYNQILVLNSFMVLALIIGVVYLLQKRKMCKYIIPYVVTAAIMFPATISLSMQYVTIFAIFNLAIIAMLLFFEKILKTKNFFYLFLAIGMITCYFDLLTYPLVTLGVPLVIWLLMVNRERKMTFGKNIGQIVLSSAAWGLGYFGIWVGKWIIGSLVTGENLFNSAMDAASHRTLSATDLNEQISRTFPIEEALNKIFTEPVVFVIILILIISIALVIMKKLIINKNRVLDNLWLFVIALMPFAWYMVLTNHSAWHMFFTYRTMSVLVFAVGCYVFSVLEKPKKSNRIKEKNG